MLQKMRDQTQSFGFKVLVGAIIFVLAVFGFGAFNLFATGEPEVASVNGDGITERELQAATEREARRLAAQMGENFDPSLIDPLRLQGAVLEQLIAERLLAQATDDLGVGVSRARVDRLLASTPAFQIDGRFSREVYLQSVRSMGFTGQAFIEDSSQRLALQQLQGGISGTAFLSDRDLSVHARLLGQRRDIAYLPFTQDGFLEAVEITDEAVRLHYDENQRDYMTEETVDVAYVVLGLDELLDDPEITVTEDELRESYEAERAAAPSSERRRSRHILLETGEARSTEEAIAELDDIRARVEAGESFADIAGEVSDDVGSAAQGGDLGFAGRGIYDPAFEAALFELPEPDAVSQPVESAFGVHLIQLVEVREDEYPSFDEVRAEFEQRLRTERAATLFQDRLRELDRLAFERSDSLGAIEESLGLTVHTVEGVSRSSGPAPFDRVDARTPLFTDDALDKRYNTPAVDLGDDRAVVARVVERYEPELLAFDAVADEIRVALESEQADVMAQAAFQDARQRLEEGASAAEVAAAHDGNWQTFEGVTRNTTEVPRNVLQAAFLLPRPPANGKSVGSAGLPAGGTALVTVTRVEEGQRDALTEAELENMRRFLADRVGRLDFTAFFETLRREASIERLAAFDTGEGG